MSEIDRQRVRGVEVVREMGFTRHEGRWQPFLSGGCGRRPTQSKLASTLTHQQRASEILRDLRIYLRRQASQTTDRYPRGLGDSSEHDWRSAQYLR